MPQALHSLLFAKTPAGSGINNITLPSPPVFCYNLPPSFVSLDSGSLLLLASQSSPRESGTLSSRLACCLCETIARQEMRHRPRCGSQGRTSPVSSTQFYRHTAGGWVTRALSRSTKRGAFRRPRVGHMFEESFT